MVHKWRTNEMAFLFVHICAATTTHTLPTPLAVARLQVQLTVSLQGTSLETQTPAQLLRVDTPIILESAMHCQGAVYIMLSGTQATVQLTLATVG